MASQPATSKRHELELGGLHFPLYEELPPYGDAPFRGWTFLGEIIKDESYGFGTFGRPLARVRDLSGKADILIAFYLDADQPKPVFKVGQTMAVDGATTHFFMDGQVGLRLEETSRAVVLPLSLAALKTLNGRLWKAREECSACGKGEATKKCAKCAARYCSQECQVDDWKARHKKECLAIQHLRKWNDRYE